MTCTLLEIMATPWAKRHVEIDSSSCPGSGVTVATMVVRQLPPNESRRAWGGVEGERV